MTMNTDRLPLSSSKSLFLIAFLAAALGAVGCQQEGAAEKAGEKIDQAAEKAGDKMGEATQEAGDKMDEAAKKAGDKMD